MDADINLNLVWERKIRDSGADFVRFVDITSLTGDETLKQLNIYSCAVLFGKALSADYVNAIKNDRTPKTKEIFNTERKMDLLAEKVRGWLEADGYKSVCKLPAGLLPHKTVALRAGLGFIGKNNLLVTPEYGCALMMGKVLTTAPFIATAVAPAPPLCGDCDICVNSCPTGALLGTEWSITKKREDIITRKLCTLCHKCMVMCPYTAAYATPDNNG